MEATALARSLLSPPSLHPALSLSSSATSPRLSLPRTSMKNNLIARCSTEEPIPNEKRFLPFPSVIDINQIREICSIALQRDIALWTSWYG